MFAALCVKGQHEHGPGAGRARCPAWKVLLPVGWQVRGRGQRRVGQDLWPAALRDRRVRAALPVRRASPWPIPSSRWRWRSPAGVPFIPGNADDSSLPVAALEYRFANTTAEPVEAIFSFHAQNFMALRAWGAGTARPGRSAIRATANGFALWKGPSAERPWDQGAFSAVVDDPAVKVNCAWFRGGWFDPLTVAWKIGAGRRNAGVPGRSPRAMPSTGGSLYVPFRLAPGQSKTIRRAAGLARAARPSCATARILPRRRGRCVRRSLRAGAAGNPSTTALVRGQVRRHRGGERVLARALRLRCAPRLPPSPIASTTPPSRPKWSRRWRPT